MMHLVSYSALWDFPKLIWKPPLSISKRLEFSQASRLGLPDFRLKLAKKVQGFEIFV